MLYGAQSTRTLNPQEYCSCEKGDDFYPTNGNMYKAWQVPPQRLLLSNTGLEKIKNYRNATVVSNLNNKTVSIIQNA